MSSANTQAAAVLDTPLRFGWRGRPRPPLLVGVALVVVAVVVVCAIVGPVIAPKDPGYQSLVDKALPPGGEYALGTDNLGRDILSRVIAGARAAIVGPGLIAVGVLICGSVIGLVAGYFGGRVDAVLMRWADFVLAFPHLLIVLVVGGIVGGGYALAVGLLILFLTPHAARLVRGATLQQRTLPYIEAAESVGIPRWQIIARHLWPNVAPLAVAFSFLAFAIGLVALASLSFLGVGVPPGTADWGRMLVENRLLLQINPWAALAPGAAIVLTAASMNIVGDWMMERLDA